MAKTAMVIGASGDGKSTAIVINPDGKYFEDPKWKEEQLTYEGLNPETTVLFNCDGKEYPFPAEKLGWKEGTNMFTSTYEKPMSADLIEAYCDKISAGTKIKTIIIDTINGSMNDKEMLETRKMTFDKWYDLAKDYYKLCVKANSYRKDLIIYLFGHVIVNDAGNKALVTNGKKLEKIELESKVSVVLLTHVENGVDGDNKFMFETQKANSSGKSPIGMFDEFLIPNSLKLVDDKIRKYYGI
jgi:hypothetical protein